MGQTTKGKSQSANRDKQLAVILRKRLENAERVAIPGVGSELRADDVAGILVARRIKEPTAKKKPREAHGFRKRTFLLIALTISIAHNGSEETTTTINQSATCNGTVLKISWKSGR